MASICKKSLHAFLPHFANPKQDGPHGFTRLPRALIRHDQDAIAFTPEKLPRRRNGTIAGPMFVVDVANFPANHAMPHQTPTRRITHDAFSATHRDLTSKLCVLPRSLTMLHLQRHRYLTERESYGMKLVAPRVARIEYHSILHLTGRRHPTSFGNGCWPQELIRSTSASGIETSHSSPKAAATSTSRGIAPVYGPFTSGSPH